MAEKPPTLAYAGRGTPEDSRRARRMIALGLSLFLAGLLLLHWRAWAWPWPDDIRGLGPLR